MPFGPGAAHAAAGATPIGVQFVSTGSEDQLAADLEAAIVKAMGVAARTISTALRKALKDFGSGQAASQFQKNITGAANKASAAMGKLQDRIDNVERTMRRIGSSSQEFETLIRQTHVVAESFDDMRAARERAARDPGFQKQIIAETEAAQKLANTVQRSALKEVTVAESAFKKEAEARRVSEQTQSQAAKREAAERIVTMQTEAAREVALTKAGAQRRVEIIRAVVSQIRALERGLAAVFRATASAIGGTFRAVGGILRTVTAPLRNFRSELTVGLDASLEKRSSLLRRHFSSEESIMRSSVSRQEIMMQKLDTRLSKGVVGAATGRSRLGGLFGGLAAGFGGAGLFIGLQKLFTVSADFEQGLAVLDAQLGLTDKQMASVRQTAIDLGNDLTLPGVSAKQGAEAIQILAKQFGALGKGAVPAAQKAAKGVLQLSRATQSSAEDAAALVGTAVNVFGISADKAVSVADEITGALTKAAGVGFGDFSLAFKQGASVFAQFQVPAVGAKEALLEFNTAIAVLAKGGLVGSDAGTSLKQFFLQASRGTADSTAAMKELTKRAGETGGAFFDAAGKARPLTESLDIMRKGLEGMSDEARNKTLQKIFGSDAIRAANILLGTSSKTFDAIHDGIQKEGLAAQIAAAQNTGLRGAMDALSSVVETMAIEILPKITVPLGKFVLGFASFVTSVKDADSGAFKIIRDGLKGIAIGLGAILAVKTAIEVLQLLGPAISGLLTPFGLLAIAAAGIGALFFILRDNSKVLGKPLQDLQKQIRDFAGKGIDFLKDKFNELVAFLTGTVLPGLQHVAETVGTFLMDVFTGSDLNDQLAQISGGIDTRTLGEKIGDKIRDIFGVARRVVGNVQELLGDLFFGIDFNDAFTQSITGQDTRSAAEKIGGRIREVFQGAFRVARDAVRKVVGNIQELLGDLVFGTDFADAFAFSITGSDTRSKFERIGGKIREIFQPIFDGVKGALDDIADLILNFDLGKALRIGGVIAAAFGGFAIAGPVGAAIAGTGAAIGLLFGDSLGKGIVETLGNIGKLVVGALKGPFEAVKEFVTGFFTLDNLRSITAAFLDVVEQVGFIIANIVTDPRVLAVVAGLAALAAAAAFRFVQGLAEGIKDNLPGIGRLLLTGLKALGEVALDGLAEVFKNPQILLIALGSIFVGSRLLTMFRTAGADGGRSFMAGFKQTAFSGALRGGGAGTLFGSGGAFITGLIGSPGNIQAAVDRELSRTAASAGRKVSEMRSVLRIAGKDFIGPRTQSEVQQAFKNLSKTVGPAGIAGLQLRAAFKATFDSLKTLSLSPLKALGKSTITAMATMGKNMAGALAAGFAGFQTGQSLKGAGLMQQLLGVGGLALGIGAINVPAGIAAGALGVLGIVMGDTGSQADVLKQKVTELGTALLGSTDPIQVMTQTILENFDLLNQGAKDTADIVGLHINDLVTNVQNMPFASGAAQKTFLDAFTGIDQQLDPIIQKIQLGHGTMADFFSAIADGSSPAGDQLHKLGISADDAREFLYFLGQQADLLKKGEDDAALKARLLGHDVDDSGKKAKKAGGGWKELTDKIKESTGIDISKIFGGGLNAAIGATTTTMEALRQKSDETKSKIEELFQVGAGGPTTLQGALDDFVLGLPGIASQLESVLFPPEGVTVPQQFIDATKDKTGAALSEALGSLVVAAHITTVKGVREMINNEMIPAIQAEVDAGRIKPKVGMEMIASLQKVVLDPTFLANLRNAFANQKAVDAQIKIRAQLKADKLTKAQIDAVMASIIAGGGTGPAHPLVGTPFTVHIPIKGVPKGTPITVEEYVNALLGEDGKPPTIPLDVPVKLNPVQTTPFQQLTPRQVRELVGLGPQGFAGGGGTGETAIDIPVAATPVVTMLAPSLGFNLEADVLRVLGVEGDVAAVSLVVPVQAIPQVDVIPPALGFSLNRSILGALGLRGGVAAIRLVAPVSITPKLSIRKANAPTAADIQRVLGLKLVVINVPVQINPVVAVAGGAAQGAAGIGTGIAAAVAQGVAAGAPLIAVALAVGLGRALQASGNVTNQFRAIGAQAAVQVAQGVSSGANALGAAFSRVGATSAQQMASGITSQRGGAVSAGNNLGASAASGADSGSSGMFGIGSSAGQSFASGVGSAAGSAFSAGSSLGSSASAGASGGSLYSEGANLSSSMASGILAGRSSVINAAISVAQSAVSAARSALGIRSPSRIFRGIGRDIGKGLALGLADSETGVVSAVQSAIDKAIETAREAVPHQAAQRAALASGIFEQTTLPTRLPGGPTNIDVERILRDSLDGIHGLIDLAKEHQTTFDEMVQSNKDVRAEIQDTKKQLSEDLKSIRDEGLQKISDALAKGAAGLDIARQRVNLGGLSRQFTKAFNDLFSDIPAFQPPVQGESEAEKKKREAENAHNDELRRQAHANARALNINTAAGRGATNMILDFGEQIREFGTSLLEGGARATTVRRQMERYRDQLVTVARAQGINRASLQDLIQELGLTDRQLNRFVASAGRTNENVRERLRKAQQDADKAILDLRGQLQRATGGSLSLGMGSAGGRENRTIISDALQGIRDFGKTALEAGRPTAQVVTRMKQMRQELIGNAVAMGFNRRQILSLVELMGLTNAQLKKFTQNLADANNEATTPPTPPTPGTPTASLPGPLVGAINITTPYGDPEAIGLTVANRVAFFAA